MQVRFAGLINGVEISLPPGVSSGQAFLIGGCMASITGFGGIFLRADDPKALYQWYERHLGLVKSDGSFAFPASTQRAQVVFALFKQDTLHTSFRRRKQ
jgi:hypothetical protein